MIDQKGANNELRSLQLKESWRKKQGDPTTTEKIQLYLYILSRGKRRYRKTGEKVELHLRHMIDKRVRLNHVTEVIYFLSQ